MIPFFKSKPEKGKSNAPDPKAIHPPSPKALPPQQQQGQQLQQSIGNQSIANLARQSASSQQAPPTGSKLTTLISLQSYQSLLDENKLEAIYTNKLYHPLMQAVLLKFGVGRGEWRRSDELNEFRNNMKDAARAQANEEITNQLDKHEATKGKSTLGKAFYGMLAKKEAYSLSKGSVDSVMEREAQQIVSKVLPPDSAKQQLKQAAQISAHQLASEQQHANEKTLREAALKGAKIKAIELLKHTQTLAVAEARNIVKGQKGSQTPSPDLGRQDQLKTSVKTQVTKDQIAGQAIKLAIESDTLNSGLVKIGKIIDIAVPNIGDGASFSFDLKIPIGQTGTYCIIHLGAEAEREENDLTVAAEIGLGAGFQVFGLDANVQVGLFVESKAKNSSSVMNLISYGMYRHLRAVLPEAADHFWGQGGKSGMTQLEEAELWAAMIEAQDLHGENAVDVGTYKQLSAELKTGVANADLSLAKKKLTHFDQKTIAAITNQSFGDQTKLNRLLWKAERLKNLAQNEVYEAQGGLELDLGFGSLNLQGEGKATYANSRIKGKEVSIGASIPFQYGEDSADFINKLNKIATPTLNLLINVSQALDRRHKSASSAKAKQTSPPQAGSGQTSSPQPAAKAGSGQKTPAYSGFQQAGTVADTASDVMFMVPQFDRIGASLAKQIQEFDEVTGKIENKIALSAKTGVTFNFEKSWDQSGTPGNWEISVELGQTKSFEVDAGIASVSVEKTKKLLKLDLG